MSSADTLHVLWRLFWRLKSFLQSGHRQQKSRSRSKMCRSKSYFLSKVTSPHFTHLYPEINKQYKYSYSLALSNFDNVTAYPPYYTTWRRIVHILIGNIKLKFTMTFIYKAQRKLLSNKIVSFLKMPCQKL